MAAAVDVRELIGRHDAGWNAQEWTARATAPDGRALEWDGVDVFPLRGGLIARKDVYSTSHIPRALGN